MNPKELTYYEYTAACNESFKQMKAAGAAVAAAYWFAKAQLVDDGDPSNDLTLLGQTEGFSIALLALKTRLAVPA